MTFRFVKWSDSQDDYKDDILGIIGRRPGVTVSIETQGSTNTRGFPTITTSRCRLLDLVTLLSLTWSPGTQAWDTGFIWVLEPVQSVQSINLTCVSPSKGNFLWAGNMFYSFTTWPSLYPCPISSPRSTNPAHSQDFKRLSDTISSKDGGKHYIDNERETCGNAHCIEISHIWG